MRKFKSLRLDPPERLEILKQEVVLGKLGWQLDAIVTATLWDPSHSL
jgi:hypothetical protein